MKMDVIVTLLQTYLHQSASVVTAIKCLFILLVRTQNCLTPSFTSSAMFWRLTDLGGTLGSTVDTLR